MAAGGARDTFEIRTFVSRFSANGPRSAPRNPRDDGARRLVRGLPSRAP